MYLWRRLKLIKVVYNRNGHEYPKSKACSTNQQQCLDRFVIRGKRARQKTKQLTKTRRLTPPGKHARGRDNARQANRLFVSLSQSRECLRAGAGDWRSFLPGATEEWLLILRPVQVQPHPSHPEREVT
jgi:hypothetical protein